MTSQRGISARWPVFMLFLLLAGLVPTSCAELRPEARFERQACAIMTRAIEAKPSEVELPGRMKMNASERQVSVMAAIYGKLNSELTALMAAYEGPRENDTFRTVEKIAQLAHENQQYKLALAARYHADEHYELTPEEETEQKRLVSELKVLLQSYCGVELR